MAEELEKARKAEERVRVQSQRGDLPCSATRQNSSQSGMPLSQEDTCKSNKLKKGSKEPRWNGGMTHKRSCLGERTMEMLGKLERDACQAARDGKLMRKRGDGCSRYKLIYLEKSS